MLYGGIPRRGIRAGCMNGALGNYWGEGWVKAKTKEERQAMSKIREAEKVSELLSRILYAKEESPTVAMNEAFTYECKEYERFYLGEQVDGGGPVMNITKRICDYVISTLCSKEYTISYTLDGAPRGYFEGDTARGIIDELGRMILYKNDKESLEKLLFSMVRDAVIYGTGILYTYFDKGNSHEVQTKAIEPYRVIPADIGEADIERQRYILIRGRTQARLLSEEAKSRGLGKGIYEELKEKSCGECSDFWLMLYKEGGTVRYIKESCGILISYGDTGLLRYPLVTFKPIPRKGSFYGVSYVKGIIPNQRYINESYAMLMKHMQETAFSKVVYDKSRIPEWSGEPGIAIAAHGGGNLADCVSVVGCGRLEDGYIELTHDIAERTKELYGATETALGNVEPTNTSAIMAVKEASEGQLRGCIILLTAALEEQARVWADAACAYFGGRSIYSCNGNAMVDLRKLKMLSLRCRTEVSDRSRFGSSVAMEVLNKLFEAGAISAAEYLKRIPDGIISDREALIDAAESYEGNKNKAKEEGK